MTQKRDSRLKRKLSIRKRVSGDTLRPRLSVFRSAEHIYAQVIDDVTGTTLAAASTLSPDFKALSIKSWGREAATKVGELLAAKALARKRCSREPSTKR